MSIGYLPYAIINQEYMNIEELYDYCLSIPGAEVTTPFDDVTLVMKVCDKMFALIPVDADRVSVALKCET